MASSLRASWFGRQVVCLLSNGQSVNGTVTEATDTYIILEDASGTETQVMVHAVLAIKLAQSKNGGLTPGHEGDGPMARRFGFGRLIDTLLLVVAVGIVGGGAYLWVSHKMDRRRVEADLKRQLAEERKKLAEARRHLTALLGEKRVAQVRVLERNETPDGDVTLKIRFLEFSPDGTSLKPREIEIHGQEVYFDALVIMFKADEVMAERAASLHVFRRIFTDKTQPEKGFALTRIDSEDVPESYRSPEIPEEIQRKVWEEIRQLITDENFRARRGVRAVFGQAVYKKLERGKIYTLRIQNNGGLLIEEEPIPEIMKDE